MENTLEKINKAGLKFLSSLTLQETYNIAVEEAVKLVDSSSGALFLADKKNKLKRVAVYPLSKRLIIPRKKGFTYQAYIERKIIVAPSEEINKIHKELEDKEYRLAIFIPLSYHNQSIGTLNLITINKKNFSGKELKVLKIFGSYVSLAIRKAELFEKLNESLSTKDLFIAMAAHEFRTPLTTVNGYLQLLQTKTSELTPRTSTWIKELSWEVCRLTLLVNELLEVSRINTGQLQFTLREHSLKKIVDRAILDFGFNYPNRKIVFDDQLDHGKDLIIGDFDKLLQVVINLIDNAVKFSDEGTTISVTLKSYPLNLCLYIKDQGRGIAQSDLPRIFEGFYKGDKTLQKGMGLGLYLAKKIVDQHRGIIHVSSKINKGTIVKVSLPKVRI